MRAYDVHIDETELLGSFNVAIGPAGRSGPVAMKGGLSRSQVLSLLLNHMQFTEHAAMRYMDTVEAETAVPLVNQWLNEADALALGWLPAYDRPAGVSK